MLQETPSLRIIVAFPTNSPLHQFPLTKNDRKQLLCVSRVRFLLRQPGNSHLGRNITHWRVLREANVESGLSLQTRRELLQSMTPQYREASTIKRKSRLLDATTRSDGIQSQVRHVAPQPCERGAVLTSAATPTPLRVRSPTRVVPGLARCQPDLCQTPHPFSSQACLSAGKA
jgi:hypothetical protein